MSPIRNLTMAAVLVLGGAAGTGALATSAAPPPAATTTGSQLDADIYVGEAGEQGTANDQETAAEQNIDDSAVENVAVQENQAGVQETGTANDKAEAAGD